MKIIELIADPETRESTRLDSNDSATAGSSGTDNGSGHVSTVTHFIQRQIILKHYIGIVYWKLFLNCVHDN